MNTRAAGLESAIRDAMGQVRGAAPRTADAVESSLDELVDRVDSVGFRDSDPLGVAVREARVAFHSGDSVRAIQQLSRALLLITITPTPRPKRKGE